MYINIYRFNLVESEMALQAIKSPIKKIYIAQTRGKVIIGIALWAIKSQLMNYKNLISRVIVKRNRNIYNLHPHILRMISTYTK